MRTRSCAAVAAFLLLSGCAVQPAGSTTAPSATDEITSSGRAVALLEERISPESADHTTLTILGELQLRRARETGDIAGYLLAEDSFRKALAKEPRYLTGQAFLASALYLQHRFEEALDIAREVNDANPERIDARTVIADVLLATGRYDEAERIVDNLLDQTADPAIVARKAMIAETRGQLADASEMMTIAAAQTVDSGVPRHEAAWYFARLASVTASKGDLLSAAEQAEEALSIYREHPAALRALATVRQLQGSETEAMYLLEREIKALPSPGAYFALADVYTRLGLEEDALRMAEKGLTAANVHPLAERIYRAEVARFLVEHDRDLGRALALARLEAAEREDVRTLDLLAWALYKTGSQSEAIPLARRAISVGTLDPDLLLHAGLIELHGGDGARGEEILRRLVETRAGSPQAESAAKALEERNGKDVKVSEVIGGGEPGARGHN